MTPWLLVSVLSAAVLLGTGMCEEWYPWMHDPDPLGRASNASDRADRWVANNQNTVLEWTATSVSSATLAELLDQDVDFTSRLVLANAAGAAVSEAWEYQRFEISQRGTPSYLGHLYYGMTYEVIGKVNVVGTGFILDDAYVDVEMIFHVVVDVESGRTMAAAEPATVAIRHPLLEDD